MNTSLTELERQRLKDRADDWRNSGQTKDAVALYKALFPLAELSQDWQMAGDCLQMIGVSYKIDNQTEDSLAWLTHAARYFKERGNTKGVASCLRDTAITYEYAHDFATAEKYLKESLALYDTMDDLNGHGITLAKLGLLQTQQEKYKDAEVSLENALKLLCHPQGEWFFLATTLLHLARLRSHQEQCKTAINLIEEAKSLFDVHPDSKQTRRYAQMYGGLAYCFAKLGDRMQAKKYHALSEEIIKRDLSESAAEVVREDVRAEETKQLLEK